MAVLYYVYRSADGYAPEAKCIYQERLLIHVLPELFKLPKLRKRCCRTSTNTLRRKVRKIARAQNIYHQIIWRISLDFFCVPIMFEYYRYYCPCTLHSVSISANDSFKTLQKICTFRKKLCGQTYSIEMRFKISTMLMCERTKTLMP